MALVNRSIGMDGCIVFLAILNVKLRLQYVLRISYLTVYGGLVMSLTRLIQVLFS